MKLAQFLYAGLTFSVLAGHAAGPSEKKPGTEIQAVTFSGSLGLRESHVRRALHATRPKTMLPGIPGIWHGWRLLQDYTEDAVQSDLVSLRSFYYRHGYFDADVWIDSVRIDQGKAHVQYDVEAGPHYSIRQFTLMGADGAREIPAQAACRELLTERRQAERTGVFDVSAKMELHEFDGHSADVVATVERGPVYRVGRIEFRGNHRFSEAALRRSLLLDEGAPLDQTLLRESLARLKKTGFFEPSGVQDVAINTPPGSDQSNVTIRLKEKKFRSWMLSGPVGPMSVAGPLEFALGSRLPPWGRGVLELSTYTVSLQLMVFAKPIGALVPFLPNKRFVPLVTLQRPLLPGSRFLSGFSLAPQLGWQGMLAGYGISQARSFLGGALESDHDYQPELAVTIQHAGAEQPDGTMYCTWPRTNLDRARQVAGIMSGMAFSFLPF